MQLKQVLRVLLVLMLTSLMLPTILRVHAEAGFKETFAVISVTPNPVGVNQIVYIVGGITDARANISGIYNLSCRLSAPGIY